MSPSIDEPAHVTSACTRGWDASSSPTRAKTASSSVRSMTCVVCPVPASVRIRAASPSAFRSRSASRAPRRSSSRATSAPMPLAAPVMTVVRPRTSSRCILAIVFLSCAVAEPQRRFSPTRPRHRDQCVFGSLDGGGVVRMTRTAEAIEEGLSIASAAARLTVRNHILVEAIANDAAYDYDRVAAFAHDTLIALADEQADAAATVRRQRKAAWGKYSDSHGTHDYRDRDTRNLRRRQRQYVGVSKEL